MGYSRNRHAVPSTFVAFGPRSKEFANIKDRLTVVEFFYLFIVSKGHLNSISTFKMSFIETLGSHNAEFEQYMCPWIKIWLLMIDPKNK